MATEAVKGDRQLLILGSLLPESFPFIKKNPFGLEEIHEGGERFLEFLDRRYPKSRDLALGILSHSKKFGADKWSERIEDLAGDSREDFLNGITQVSRWSNLMFAKYRLHNFLWWGLDIWILRKKPDFVNEVKLVLKEVNIDETSKLLTECFGRDYVQVKKAVATLFKKIYQWQDLTTVNGLAHIWQRQAAGLPEKDKVDPLKTAVLFEEIYFSFQNNWEGILERVITGVKKNLGSFVSSR